MKLLTTLIIAFANISFANANPLALKKDSVCFDPRTAFIQCKDDTEFKGWNKGTCSDGLVANAICEEKCFDPKVTTFQCEEGTEFKGWDKGECKKGLVESAICK